MDCAKGWKIDKENKVVESKNAFYGFIFLRKESYLFSNFVTLNNLLT